MTLRNHRHSSHRIAAAIALSLGIGAMTSALADDTIEASDLDAVETTERGESLPDIVASLTKGSEGESGDRGMVAASARTDFDVAERAPQTPTRLDFDSNQPFPYIAIRQPIRDVLQAFRLSLGVPILGDIDGKALVSVDGSNKTPREFLEAATSQAGLEWYYDGMSLHVVGTDRMKSRLLDMGGVSVDDLEMSLDALRLGDPRFQISVSPDADVAMVQGPEPFVEAVASLLKTLRERRPAVAGAPSGSNRIDTTTFPSARTVATATSSDDGPRVFRGTPR